jgi:hypothetical protein
VADINTKQRELIAGVRDSISDAYAFVRGAQYNRQVGSTTYEELLDTAIGKIRGTPNVQTSRPCKLDRIQAVQDNLTSALTAVQNTPVEEWIWGTDQDVPDKDKANIP